MVSHSNPLGYNNNLSVKMRPQKLAREKIQNSRTEKEKRRGCSGVS